MKPIADGFGKCFPNAKTTRLVGQKATEDAIRGAVGNATLVHIQSHGFYLPLERTDLNKNDRQPTGRSGLAVANANRGINQGDVESGIVWSSELATFDFTRSDLVVLSACETAKGTEVSGEGQLGLQRALATAGAKASLTTLWKVENASTITLMQRYYHHLFHGGADVSEALRRAKVEMLSMKGSDGSDADRPNRLPIRAWAPFVVFGNPTVRLQQDFDK